jgi:excisionase family DNA binding protein
MRDLAEAQAPLARSNALLTAAEVADRWRVRPSAVYALARSGRLPSVSIGRYRRFRVESIERFELEGGVDVE